MIYRVVVDLKEFAMLLSSILCITLAGDKLNSPFSKPDSNNLRKFSFIIDEFLKSQ